MDYRTDVTLKDGTPCTIRTGTADDAAQMREELLVELAETEFLRSYPDEMKLDVQQEAEWLDGRAQDPRAVELVAVVDGEILGHSGIWPVDTADKERHRAEFGISIGRRAWDNGLGRALAEAALECARQAGYRQLELEVVAENERARALYQKVGFREHGRVPRGFHTRDGRDHDLILMWLPLDTEAPAAYV